MQWSSVIPFFSIQQELFPFLVLAGESGVLPWDYGRLFALRMSSHYIRVTARGVQFSTQSALSSIRPIDRSIWTKSVSCLPTPHALCREGPGLVFFPDDVVDVPYDFSQIPDNTFLQKFPNGSSCKESSSMRAISIDDNQYDVSLCDLLNSNLDLILDCHSDELHWRQDDTGFVEYAFVSLMSVYMMSCISANVIRMSKMQHFYISFSDFCCLCLNLVYIAAQFLFAELRFIATDGDVILCFVLWMYVLVETLFMGIFLLRSAERPDHMHYYFMGGISVYTAMLLLFTLRVHYTFDNPYLQILTVMFGTRTFMKVSDLVIALNVQSVVVLFDVMCFSTILALGVGLSSDDLFDAVQHQTTLVVVCVLLSTGIALNRVPNPAS